ncbi:MULTISPECIES: head completion/stabilization protein [Pandoraea]|uniref:head completion/stabilization protein n=1 Tax=Pandoraea TaxID=93217 RepID=UPI001F5CE9B2|nr:MULTISPECIES: head completion/stabilization protein [Pandoraea]MCI3205821.1 head completion/stabilization protein [Pandoraea sp. LA3]MDN4583849.1 head completion/stabilization protein [Pandoraea capi]
MSFLAAAPTTDAGETVKNDGFFPDIDITTMRDTQRLDGTVTEPRLKAEVIEAMLYVNGALSNWRSQRVAEGFETLADVKTVGGRAVPEVAGTTAFVIRYTRAVFCWAHASLIERYRNFDATATARKEDDVTRPGADELRRDANWAINDITGATRSTVELI